MFYSSQKVLLEGFQFRAFRLLTNRCFFFSNYRVIFRNLNHYSILEIKRKILRQSLTQYNLFNILEKFRLITNKAVTDIQYKNIVQKLPDEMLNDLRFRILGNFEILGKCQNWVKQRLKIREMDLSQFSAPAQVCLIALRKKCPNADTFNLIFNLLIYVNRIFSFSGFFAGGSSFITVLFFCLVRIFSLVQLFDVLILLSARLFFRD